MISRILLCVMLSIYVNVCCSYSIDCLNQTRCQCGIGSGYFRVDCSIEDDEVFDFQGTDLRNITYLKVTGKVIIFTDDNSLETLDSLKTLHVEGNRNPWELSNGFLSRFPYIEHLIFRDCNLSVIHANAFKGLSQLRTLDLSVNGNLAYNVVEEGLQELGSRVLTLLNLSAIHNPDVSGNFPFGRISYKFLKLLANTTLEVLDISWSQVHVFEASAKYVPFLRSFNFSGTDLAFIPACVTTFFSHENITEMVLDFWPYTGNDVGVAKFSQPRYKYSVSDQCEIVPFFKDGCYQFPPNLRTLQARFSKLSAGELLIDFTRTVCIEADNLLNLILAGSVLPSSFVSIEGIENLNLFDLSYPTYNSEELDYPAIYSKFFRTLPSLKVILVPGNRIYVMNQTELIGLFSTNINLEIVDISSNRLTSIPSKMFANNIRLTHIDISGNELTYFGIDSSSLLFLERVDLSNNQLVTLDIVSLSLAGVKTLILTNNSFPCDCTINDIILSNITNLQMTCKTEDGLIQAVHQNESYLYPCLASATKKQNIILFIIVPSLCVVLLFVIAFMLFRQLRKRSAEQSSNNSNFMSFVHFVPAANPQIKTRSPRFLAFVAYSHHDGELVCSDIVPKLEEALRKLLPSYDGDILCLYDKHFLPGDGIDEACEQAVLNSYVLVAIITKSFLNSGWCSFELQQAISQQVPIIPLYMIACPSEDYSGIFKVIFEEKIRLNWPMEPIDENIQNNSIVGQQDSFSNAHSYHCKELLRERVIVIEKLAAAIYSNVLNQKNDHLEDNS